MMKLSLMRDVFETVNSDWDCGIASDLASGWDIDESWIKLWRASANFICFTRSDEENYILRFNKLSEKSMETWASEIKLLQALRAEGLRISEPVPARDTSFVQKSDTGSGTFLSVLYRKVMGEQYEIEDLDSRKFTQWGAALGALHKAGYKIEKTSDLKRMSHGHMLKELLTSNPPANEYESREYDWARAWIGSLPITSDNCGIIHYDFELDNLIWDDEGIQIIDFEDSIRSWYVADIAHALRDLFDEGSDIDLDNANFKLFVEGYRSQKAIGDEQLDLIPNFYRLFNLVIMKRLERSVDIDVSEANPDWLNGLISKLTDMKNICARKIISYQK